MVTAGGCGCGLGTCGFAAGVGFAATGGAGWGEGAIADLGRSLGREGIVGVDGAVGVPGAVGASWMGLKSLSFSGFGAGEMDRDGGFWGGWGVTPSEGLLMFSKRASSDETGLWGGVRLAVGSDGDRG